MTFWQLFSKNEENNVPWDAHTHVCKDTQRLITLVASRRELDRWEMKIEGRHFTGHQCFSNYLVGRHPCFFSHLSQTSTWHEYFHSATSVCPLSYQLDNLQTDLFPFPGLESTAFKFALQCHIAIKVPNSLILNPNFSCVPEQRVRELALPYTFLYFWLRDITHKKFLITI